MSQSKKIGSPDILLEWWNEYKKSVDEDLEHIEEVTAKGVMTRTVKKPYLRQGFEAWCFRHKGLIIHQYIDNYNNTYEEFLGVVTCMRKEWENDQIVGTLTGRYKAPNLVARLNGLTETVKTEQNINVNKLPEWLTKPIE